MQPRTVPHGFSLLECLIALSVFGLLLGLATSSYHQHQEQQATRLAQIQLTQLIDWARTYALVNKQMVSLYTGRIAGCGSDRHSGMIQVCARDGEGQERLVRVLSGCDEQHCQLRWVGIGAYLRFVPTVWQTQANGRWFYQRRHSPYGFELCVNRLGRVRDCNQIVA